MAKTQKNKHKSRIRQRKSRRVIGSRVYKNYTEEMLKLACESVESGQISSRDAQRQFGIPRCTILNKIKKKHLKSVGHPTALSAAEEDQIVRVLQASSDFGSPLTKVDLKLLVHEYLKKNCRDYIFKNQIPGDAWVQGFLMRNADKLTVRTTQNISKARAEKGPQEIAEYFKNLSTTLKDVPAKNIVNFDETNLSDDPGSSKCIFRRGVKYPERIANSTKGNISLMFTATASGECLPLYVVYKSINMYSEWIRGGPPETRYNCTKSGWFDSAMFENYFETIILPWAQNNSGTKVIICDNLSSHLSIKVIELCEQNNIKFVFIPSRSTHLTQPLDVAFFGPLKKTWRKILHQYKLHNPNQITLNKNHFPKLLGELIEAIKMREAKNIISGFRASGIYPFNPQEVLKKIPEIQQEVLSYGIDQALVDYLKETRAPKPMLVKKNKKIHCEPGKSVTISDLNVHSSKSTATKKSTKCTSTVANVERKTEESLFLDEETGRFSTKTDLFSDDVINQDQEGYLDLDRCFVISQDQDITYKIINEDQESYLDCEGDNTQYQDDSSPQSLSKLCTTIINSCLGLSVCSENTSLSLADLLQLKSFTQESLKKDPIKEKKTTILSGIKAGPSNVYSMKEVSVKTENMRLVDAFKCVNSEKTASTLADLSNLKTSTKASVKKDRVRGNKITVLSDVIIKAGSSNVCVLKEASNKIENKPFIATSENDLPECLQSKKNKHLKTVKNKKPTKGKNICGKVRAANATRKKSVRGRISVKNRNNKSDSESSSMFEDDVLTVKTDDSDYETVDDFYIAECLREQEEKENFESTDISFGLHEIEYFIENHENITKDDWLIAQFATKKSIKHFVGNVLAINDKIPTIKFVRKVKASKCESGTTFTYPIVDDVCTMHNLEDIITILPKPKITRRGQIVFNIDFTNFNIQ